MMDHVSGFAPSIAITFGRMASYAIAEVVRVWIKAVGAKTAYIEPGSPWENGYYESLNGRMRPSRQIVLQSPAGQWTSC